MATHTDTNGLISYTPNTFPTLGNPDRFITSEFEKIRKSISSIISVMKLLEARMNTNGLT
ncbi:hypothetical protein [Bradyrhizobium sp. USDA 4350]